MATIDPSVKEAYEAVRNGSDEWIVLGYEGSTITVHTTGAGHEDLVANLREDQAQYAYYRVEDAGRTGYVLISWVGEGTSPLKKGKVSVDKPGLKAIVKEIDIEIATSDLEDLTQAKIAQKLSIAKG